MYYVCCIDQNLVLGSMDEFSSYEDAIQHSIKIIRENGTVITSEVREEIEMLGYWVDSSVEWSVCIGQVG